MATLNVFENLPTLYGSHGGVFLGSASNGSLLIHGCYLPGDITMNSLFGISGVNAGNSTFNRTMSFGLYSMSGNTLSLANSASLSTNQTQTNHLSWFTWNLSATQTLSQGFWFFGFIVSQDVQNTRAGFTGNSVVNVNDERVYDGPFIRGEFTASTSALPGSIATSQMTKAGNQANNPRREHYPYILISA